MKQQLFLFKESLNKTHGGSKAKGKRKTLRPLSTKQPIHLILKANNPFQLLRNRESVEQPIQKYSRKFGITIYELAVQADHIHLSIKIPSRDLYRRWIRAITAVLTLKMKKLKWLLPPFTRIGTWGRDFKRLGHYIQNNKNDGSFILHCHERIDRLREQWMGDLCAKS